MKFLAETLEQGFSDPFAHGALFGNNFIRSAPDHCQKMQFGVFQKRCHILLSDFQEHGLVIELCFS